MGTSATSVTTQFGSTTALGHGSSASTSSSTVTSERLAASTASFCTPVEAPHLTLPSRSARCAWTTATSRSSAGTAVSCSPVNGHVIGAIVAVCSGRSVPR